MGQKKRNKYFFKEKELIRLQTENAKIREAIRNQGLVELDEPIHNGYYAEWILRDDILRRDDAAVFQEALDACKERIWSRNPEFRVKNRKTKKWDKINPKLRTINKQKYEALSPSAKKHFVEDIFQSKRYWRYGYTDKVYRCTLTYELVVRISKAYITHRKEHDNILYQMDAENDKMMNIVSNGNPWGGGSGNSKWYRKYENKKEKLAEERKIVDIKKSYPTITSKKDLLDL